MNKARLNIATSKLVGNSGQMDWLPRNPRTWTLGDVNRTVKSITTDPDFLEDRPLLAVPAESGKGERYIVFAGNLRLKACKESNVKTAPVVVYFPESDEDRETVKRRAMLDNGSFGSWDYDALANEWDDLPLVDLGIPAWEPEQDLPELPEAGAGAGAEGEGKPEKDEKVEALLNEAMRENVRETLEQMSVLSSRGWIASFFTKGLAQARFIRAKYYGAHFPQWVSLYFCPERFNTSANDRSVYEQMKMIAEGATDAGIAGLRTLSGDSLLSCVLIKGSYPIGGSRLPLDFPANTACALIREFAGAGASVLDPCHGWGGRMCGALLADASLYVGVDPSPEAHKGVQREADAFLPYAKGSRVELIQSPFEDAEIGDGFDIAITSPPYFDVEQYHGEDQAHIRYPVYRDWLDGFYRPLFIKTFAALKAGGVFILNVGSQTYPLLEDGKDIATKVGFILEEVRPLGGQTASGLYGNTDEDEANEKIMILRKAG